VDEVVAGEKSGGCGCDIVYPVRDLDRDGTSDVFDATIHKDDSGRYSSELTVRDGESGDPLFTPLELPGYVFAVSARVGPSAEQGLLYQAYEVRYRRGYESVVEVMIGAIDAGGRILWERSWVSTFSWRPGVTLLSGQYRDLLIIPSRGGAATQFVLATTLFNDDLTRLRLEQASAADGESSAVWMTTMPDPQGIWLSRAPDLISRGRDAVLIKVTHSLGKKDLYAIDTVGMEPSWHIRIPTYTYPMAASNLVGDRSTELLLQRWGGVESAQILAGSSGRVLWQKPMTVADVVEDGTGDGRADLLVVAQDMEKMAGRLVGTLRRIAPGGATLWRRQVSFEPGSYYESSSFNAHDGGDIDADGSSDVAVYLSSWMYPDDDLIVVREKQILLDGHTGGTLLAGDDFFPLPGSLDGVGNDAVDVAIEAESVSVSGVDGRSGRRSWTEVIDVDSRDQWDWCFWQIDVLTGRGSDDLFMVIPTDGMDQEVLLDGETGEIRWHLDQ
jgi:hypothetical protein